MQQSLIISAAWHRANRCGDSMTNIMLPCKETREHFHFSSLAKLVT